MAKDRVFSFDVFDTCLARLCGEPRLLFDVLSLKVQKAMGEDCNEHLRELFVVARIESSGCNLEEIYENVAKRFPLPDSIQQMVQLELDTEREMLVPIKATKSLVEELRQKGRILFISDMYLPSSFIREQLVKHGFFKEGDSLYVSDELQAWKYDGSLYKLVHDQENITYRQWHHYGDNRHSDYCIPRKLGIHAHHLHYDYLHYEEIWRERGAFQYQYPSILAGICRAVRLSHGMIDWQNGFVCDISAPLMVTWVLRILNDASRRGIKKLFFCARDVHSEYLIARRFSASFPEIEIKYLFISGPSLYESENRLDYFRSVGLASEIPTAIVDSCTSGKTLSILNELFRVNGIPNVRGYFFVHMPIQNMEISYSDNTLVTYENVSNYLENVGKKKVKRISGMRIFYELLFSLNFHKKTMAYKYHGERIRPEFAVDKEDDWCFVGDSSRLVKKNNDTLLLGIANAMMVAGMTDYCNEIFENIAQQTLADFISYPRKEYLEYLNHYYWNGKPFVEKQYCKNKGVWKRGCLYYTMPNFIAELLRSLSYRPYLRRQLNNLVDRIKHG